MAAADVDLTGAEPPVDEVDLTQDDDDELPASTATAAGAARLSGAAAGGGSGSARRSSGIGNPGMAARPMPWVHGLLGCKGRTDVMPPGLAEPEMLNVRLADLVCGPNLQAVISLNFCSTLSGFLEASPAVRSADYLLFVDHILWAKQELPALRFNGARLPRRVDFHKPALRDMHNLGSHHTKALLLRYPTGLRVIVLTGTLDPEKRTHFVQGVWWQDFPLLCPLPEFAEGSSLESRRPATQFGGVLFDFVECTLCGRQFRGEWGNLQILEMIAQHDFSLARAALVASVPGPKGGTHRGEAVHKWGHMQLRGILEGSGLAPFKGTVLSGTSSLNYMVPAHVVECERSFGGSLKLLWPSFEQVCTAMPGGFNDGSALTGKRDVLESKEVRERLHVFEGLEAVGREHCPPHIKQTAWLSEDGTLAAVMVGSHNWSQAAWGLLNRKSGGFFIRSYELSVVCFPSLEAAWRRSQQYAFSCTPRPGQVPLGADPALEGCERIEFVPFSAGDPAARAPCVAAAADGSRLLRLPVPLCFTTTPAKFERRSSSGSGGGGKDEPWIWGHDYGPEVRDANGRTYREALETRGLGNEFSLLERILLQEAIAESRGEGGSGGSSSSDDCGPGEGRSWAAAVAAVMGAQEQAAKRLRVFKLEPEADVFVQQAVAESLRSLEDATLQRALMASVQEEDWVGSGWRQGGSGTLNSKWAAAEADEKSPELQQALLDSMQM